MTPADKPGAPEAAAGAAAERDAEALREALREGMRIAEERYPNTLRLLEDA